jgi:hypothetical protein
MATKKLKIALTEATNLPADIVKTATYTLGAGDTTVVFNTVSNVHADLPAATGSNKVYCIKNINSGTVTIDGNGAETIDGAATEDLAQWDSRMVMDYAAGLWILI